MQRERRKSNKEEYVNRDLRLTIGLLGGKSTYCDWKLHVSSPLSSVMSTAVRIPRAKQFKSKNIRSTLEWT
jgi:hypothetical protein